LKRRAGLPGAGGPAQERLTSGQWVAETITNFIDQARGGCGGRGRFGDRRRIAETLAGIIEHVLGGGAST